jgi:hypothetical protein
LRWARSVALIAALIAAAEIFAVNESRASRAARTESGDGGTDRGSLLEVASKLFPRLTRAERALLEFADVKNVGRGDYAVAGTSANYESETYVALPDDPPNDPKYARAMAEVPRYGDRIVVINDVRIHPQFRMGQASGRMYITSTQGEESSALLQ